MAIFRCLQSGNTVTFTLQHDIDSMRGHQGYVRVDEKPSIDVYDHNAVRTDTMFTSNHIAKKRGRPRKEA